jgi:hypothetical protein
VIGGRGTGESGQLTDMTEADRDNSQAVIAALERWGEGKPPLLTAIAIEVGFAIDYCYDLLNMCRAQNKLFALMTPACFEERVPFYSNGWNLLQCVLHECALDQSDREEWIAWGKKLFSESEADRKEIRDGISGVPVEEILSAFKGLRRAFVCDLKASIRDAVGDCNKATTLDSLASGEFAEFVQNSGVNFLITSAFPCWILTGQLPDQVVRQCVENKRPTKKLRELIRIDPLVMHLPEVRELIHPSERHLGGSRRRWLATTLNGGVRKISQKDLRYRFARLIMDIAERMQWPLKAPEVETVFRIAASSRRAVSNCGVSKPIEPASFRDLANRFRGFWDLPSKPDKNSRKSIHALRRAYS